MDLQPGLVQSYCLASIMNLERYLGLSCVSAVLLAALSLLVVVMVTALACGSRSVYLLDFAVSAASESWSLSHDTFVKILAQQVRHVKGTLLYP